jgi:DNA-cytosine methyltransferase
MNVLSVFDGISAGRLALQHAGIKVNEYYRSEIDKYASQVAMHHFPHDIQLGDVTKWREWDLDWSSIDLFIGGSPCQGFSFAGKQAGTKAVLNGEEILVTDRETYAELKEKGAEFLSQSHLFWEYVLILDHIKKHNPNVKFLLENVKMKKELLQMISDALGVKDVVINSSLVSAQNRHRHYWANWEITQPEDKGILLRDILEDGDNDREKSQTILATIYKENAKSMVKRGKAGLISKVGNVNPSGNGMNGNVYHVDAKSPTLTTNKGEGVKITGIKKEFDINGGGQGNRVYSVDGKSPCLSASSGGKAGNGSHLITGGAIRGRYNEDGSTSQRLECNEQQKTNALTTVQKDNVVVYQEPLYPEATKENKSNEAKYIEHAGLNETVMKNGKTYCLTANCGGAWAKHSATKKVRTMAAVGFTQDTDVMTSHNQIKYRKLTPTECARLQTFPDGWCESVVSKSQAYKAYGNSWTVDVIAHIFKDMLNDTTTA